MKAEHDFVGGGVVAAVVAVVVAVIVVAVVVVTFDVFAVVSGGGGRFMSSLCACLHEPEASQSLFDGHRHQQQ